ncbi:ubiquitin C-terminal hydrolase L3 [Mycena rebaudengoi]|nr:ubiquitin C-terminal hydrolase L3 [Mycena rebaudengoi]
MAESTPRIHFIPIESDPSIFTQLIRALGVHSLEFQEVLSLDPADLLPSGSLALPQPIYALILLYPTTREYEAELAAAKKRAHTEGTQYTGSGATEPVIWFEQTIHNACGLYAILHAVSNLGAAEKYIEPGSLLATLLASCVPMEPKERARALETSAGIADVFRNAATQGSTAVPAAEDEVDFHYVCLIKSPLDGHLYEMDGDRNGPMDRQSSAEDPDELTALLSVAKSFIKDGNPHFQLMALVAP